MGNTYMPHPPHRSVAPKDSPRPGADFSHTPAPPSIPAPTKGPGNIPTPKNAVKQPGQ